MLVAPTIALTVCLFAPSAATADAPPAVDDTTTEPAVPPDDAADVDAAASREIVQELQPATPAPTPAEDDADDARLEALEERVGTLEAENEELRAEQELLQEERYDEYEAREEAKKFAVRVGGYVDVGLFWAQSNGSGIRSDYGHQVFPQFDNVPDAWVFAGDPLSTAVNARGEPADAGPSRALAFDSVDSRGKSSFLVNAVNMQLSAQLGRQFTAFGMVDFVPRGRDMSRTDGLFVGDFIDVKMALLRWTVPVRRFDFDIDVGKVDSVFGREYRVQESPYRTEVTPSLLCRYTCGRPVGIKTRMRFFDRAFVVAASVTNGSSYQETFAFYNEIDRNEFKTLTGRASYEIPVGGGLEIGASGQYGAQDLQSDDLVAQWQYGFDAHLEVRGFEATAEFVRGRATGSGPTDPTIPACSVAPCLDVMGAYGTIAYRALNWMMPFVRVDWRDALHQSGADFVYVSQSVRITPGMRFEVSPHVVIKAQYTVNLEVGDVPQIPNDVFTSSLVGYF